MLPQAKADSDDQLIELWLNGRSPHTKRAYRADVDRFRGLTPKPFDQVTLSDLVQLSESIGQLAPASRYRALSSMKSLLAFGHRIGYLRFDVGEVLRLPSIRDRLTERILPESDVHRILSLEDDPRNRAILTLLYASGLRVAELVSLRWRDVHPAGNAGQVTVFGKGAKTRAIQLPTSVWIQIEALRSPESQLPDDPVFRSRRGGPLDVSSVLRVVKQAAKRAGIAAAVSPHWFRHAHASHALDRGAPIHLVQATLGHSSVATTGRYLHARPKESSGKYLGL